MTIFDSIRYPISDYMVPSYKQEYIPKDIFDYWYDNYYLKSGFRQSDFDNDRQALRRLILEYDTDSCEIAKSKQNDNL